MADKNRSGFNPNAASFVPNPNAMPFVPGQQFVPPPVPQTAFQSYGMVPPQQYGYYNPQQFVVHPGQAPFGAPPHLQQAYNGNVPQQYSNPSGVMSHNSVESSRTKESSSNTIKQDVPPACKLKLFVK